MTSPSDADYRRIASLLDHIAVEQSRYRRSRLARELLLEPHLSALPGARTTPWKILRIAPETGCHWWIRLAGGLCATTSRWREPGKERATIEPEFEGPGGETQPPRVSDVAVEVVEVWAQLVEIVTTASAESTLRHLLFQARHGDVRANARQAIDAYCDLANTEARLFDAVLAARAAVRLARAVKDKERQAAGPRGH